MLQTLSEYTGGSKGWGTMICRCACCGEIVSEYLCDEDGIPTDALYDESEEHICEDEMRDEEG